MRIGAIARVEAADSLAQNKPSGDEKDAMNAVRGAACEAVRLRLQNASFQHRIMERSAVEAIPGRLNGNNKYRTWCPTPAPSIRPASKISFGTSLKKEERRVGK